MKALVYTKTGAPDGLLVKEVDKPVPAEAEALVKVHAASINAYDWRLMKMVPYFVPQNKLLGADMAGVVEAVGSNMTQFRVGDPVFGDLSACGDGAFAEYACVPERLLAHKPANLSNEEAAAVPMAALTALQGLRDKGNIQPGQKVLIQGASGGVGTFAVQIARSFGAEVTAVCSSRNVEQARSLGAQQVIDYSREDFTKNELRYDLILGVNGYHLITAYRRALAPGGVYIMAGGTYPQIFQALLLVRLLSRRGGKTMGMVTAKPNQRDLLFMKELIEAGKVKVVIDRCFPLSEAADALRYCWSGHARAKVVITM